MAERFGAARILLPEGLVGPAVVVIEDGVVASVEPWRGPAPAPDRTLAPGFVDLQVNGLDDVDVSEARGPVWDRLDAMLVASGVTTWCPTLVTAERKDYPARLDAAAEAAARPPVGRPQIAGVHLEGPFLGGCPGAHPVELLRPLDPHWLAALPPVVRLVTLAPELVGAPAAVRALVDRGVTVSLGHSDATAAQVAAAVDAGATMVTHLFNGMAPFHHRRPGVAGAALLEDRLTVCLIADLVHVDAAALALAFRAKPAGRVALVTDAVALHRRSEREPAAGARRLADGTLAGSDLRMDRAVANAVRHAGVPLADALRAASTTPAGLLGLADRGLLAPGRRADLVALGPDLTLEATWIGGRQVHGGAARLSQVHG